MRGIVRTLLRLFFRRLTVDGLENVPPDRGGLIVSWHPNGLVDPALIMAFFPGTIAFGARSGLFGWPVLGALMSAAGAVPIFRAIDRTGMTAADRLAANIASLDRLAGQIVLGNFAALFPEGISHDEPHLTTLKTGAARLYYRARQLALGERTPVIVPVTLEYDSKHIFRSSALVRFHAPIELPTAIDVAPDQDVSSATFHSMCRDLTDLIEDVLESASRSTNTWELRNLMRRTARLIRAEMAARRGASERGDDPLETDLLFSDIWEAYETRSVDDPEAVERLEADIRQYDRSMRSAGLEDHDLDPVSRRSSAVIGFALAAQIAIVYLVMPVLLVAGYLLNAVPYVVITVAAHVSRRPLKDRATIKLLGGAVLYPLTWVGAGVLATKHYSALHVAFPTIPDTPLLAGAVVTILGLLGGLAALWWTELASKALRSVRLLVPGRKLASEIRALRAQRSHLFDRLMSHGPSDAD
jgi:1-acyl-sn-glycerol-3-phosphate acyltransferase